MLAHAHMSGCPSKLECESQWLMIVGPGPLEILALGGRGAPLRAKPTVPHPGARLGPRGGGD